MGSHSTMTSIPSKCLFLGLALLLVGLEATPQGRSRSRSRARGKTRDLTRGPPKDHVEESHCSEEYAVAGQGEAALRRWSFNPDLEQCDSFKYGGEGGSRNNFVNEYTCQFVCGEKIKSSLDTPKDRTRARARAASGKSNCGCQCSNLIYRDENKKVHGNCESADDSGAQGCYVGTGSTCQDTQTTDKGPYVHDWSYEACATPVCDKPLETLVSKRCLCGLAQRETRIVGGQETEVNEYPWQVALVRKGQSAPNCGGSLISSQWILTARHCTMNPVYVAQALLGEHDVKNQDETSVVRENIIQWVNHPKYDPNTLDHDFSLLKMENPIDFLSHPHIRPICLPENDDKTYKEYLATVIGWGRVTYGGATANALREVDVNVLSNDDCGTNSNYVYAPEEITDRMLCANVEGGGKDACQGDSGGPLFTAFGDGMTPGQNYEVIGVVSWGNGCAEADSPGVYSRVSNQLDFIKRTTSDGGDTCPRK